MATIVADTQLVIEGTQPHAPYNVSGTATEFQVTLRWQPGYAGGPDYKQDYTIWYREAGFSEWTKVPVTPSGATSVSHTRHSFVACSHIPLRICKRKISKDGRPTAILK